MIHSNIEDILPAEQITTNDGSVHLLGNGGMQMMEAYSEEDISKVLAYAYENDKTVHVVSGGTKRGFGGELEQADILLSLTKYKGIVEHSVQKAVPTYPKKGFTFPVHSVIILKRVNLLIFTESAGLGIWMEDWLWIISLRASCGKRNSSLCLCLFFCWFSILCFHCHLLFFPKRWGGQALYTDYHGDGCILSCRFR
jgi:hypothetical protein